MATPPPPSTAPKVTAGVPRRHPLLDSYKRTWYFLRRNTLAMFGLGVLVFFVVLAIVAAGLSIPWYQLTIYCATNQTNPTTTISTATSFTILPGLPNGSYSYTLGITSGYTASPTSGTIDVKGAAVSTHITFTPKPHTATPSSGAGPAPAATPTSGHDYPVTFSESGLLPQAGGAFPEWSVSLNYTSAPGCVSSTKQVCTYPQGSTPPGPNCYQTPTNNPSDLAPTINLAKFSVGPLPLGSLTLAPGSPYFYDVYTSLVRGSDWSLLIATSIVLTGAIVGLLVGAVAGFFGGVVDETLMRVVDVFLSIPQVLFVIVVLAVITQSSPRIFGLNVPDSRILLLIMGFMVTWWPFYARIVRGQVLVVREQKYVEAARASGAGGGRIVRKHILPNSVYPVFIQMSLDVGTIPLLIGGLVFLGFLVLPSLQFPEWGAISANSVFDVVGFLSTCTSGPCVVPWWQILFPGVTVFLFAISVNFLSDGLRDALDPRLRR
jgi:peptide/nickel transport system permease protein